MHRLETIPWPCCGRPRAFDPSTLPCLTDRTDSAAASLGCGVLGSVTGFLCSSLTQFEEWRRKKKNKHHELHRNWLRLHTCVWNPMHVAICRQRYCSQWVMNQPREDSDSPASVQDKVTRIPTRAVRWSAWAEAGLPSSSWFHGTPGALLRLAVAES